MCSRLEAAGGNQSQLTLIGSMLFSRCVSGCRIVTPQTAKPSTIGGITFKSYGAHLDDFPVPYLTAACALGVSTGEIDVFLGRLLDTLKEVRARGLVLPYPFLLLLLQEQDKREEEWEEEEEEEEGRGVLGYLDILLLSLPCPFLLLLLLPVLFLFFDLRSSSFLLPDLRVLLLSSSSHSHMPLR